MAETMKDVWQKFKQDIKGVNEESREKRKSIEKPSLKGVSGTRILMGVWVAILTAPLLIFAVVLFIIGIMFFWDAFIGL